MNYRSAQFPIRLAPSLVAALILIFTTSLISCTSGGSAEMTRQNGSGSTSISLVTPGSELNSVRIRWFPNDGDLGYTIKFHKINSTEDKSPAKNSGGDAFAVEPAGCTSAAISGFTSGICVFDLATPAPTAIEVQIEAETINPAGTGRSSTPFFRVADYKR